MELKKEFIKSAIDYINSFSKCFFITTIDEIDVNKDLTLDTKEEAVSEETTNDEDSETVIDEEIVPDEENDIEDLSNEGDEI